MGGANVEALVDPEGRNMVTPPPETQFPVREPTPMVAMAEGPSGSTLHKTGQSQNDHRTVYE